MTDAPAYPWEAPPSGTSAELAERIGALVPRLETARLVLRAPVIGDFDAYSAIMMSARAVYMDGPHDRRAAWLDFVQCVANWPLRGHGLFTITAKAGGKVLGFINLTMEWGDHEPELGFFVTEHGEGQGYAYEAAVAVRDFGLNDLRLDSMVSYVDPGNARSIALAERLGGWRDEAAAMAFDEPVIVFRHWPLGDELDDDDGDDDGGMEAYA